MNRVLSLCLKFLAVALCSALVNAQASEQKSVAADPAKGAALYSGGDPAPGITACIPCHCVEGHAVITHTLKIGAPHAVYLKKQIYEYQGTVRNHATMTRNDKAQHINDNTRIHT